MTETADVVVVGLGAVGSAALYQLARRGARVVGIDRYSPPHRQGSSHGSTRITRLAVGEGSVYIPLVRRSNEIWAELEADSGESLCVRTGGLIMGDRNGRTRHHGQADFVGRSIEAAVEHGISHEVLSASEIAHRFPQFLLRGDEQGYFEPEAGILRPEACIAAHLAAAQRHGAQIHRRTLVRSIAPSGDGARVLCDGVEFAAAKVIVTAGPWIPALVGGAIASRLRVLRQVLYWFRTTEPEAYAPTNCPVFIWMHGDGDEDYLYGFPLLDGIEAVKVATEQYRIDTDPDSVLRSVQADEPVEMYERHVAGRLRGVTPECVSSTVCLYTATADSAFLVDAAPDSGNVLVASACSGHGFKHSAAIGEALAMQALEVPGSYDLSAFSLARSAR